MSLFQKNKHQNTQKQQHPQPESECRCGIDSIGFKSKPLQKMGIRVDHPEAAGFMVNSAPIQSSSYTC
jgi:hypothetical protein